MAKLAIKGHATLGKEVIELLEMLGGINTYKINNTETNLLYCLREEDNVVIATYPNSSITSVFTLEEFLEKYPYKIGDKVNSPCMGCIKTITSMWWDTCLNAVTYKLDNSIYTNVDQLKVFNDLQPHKEETMEERKYDDLRLDVDQDDKLATEATIDGDKITAPENYLIGKVTKVDNGVLVEFVKKQPQYPKTYEECCKVMDIDSDNYLSIRNLYCDEGEEVTTKYERDILDELAYLWELKICRDAYWKIAGDWKEKRKEKAIHYVICFTLLGEVVKGTMQICLANYLLDFPTEEMRDAFYENFKDLIEECKEFL